MKQQKTGGKMLTNSLSDIHIIFFRSKCAFAVQPRHLIRVAKCMSKNAFVWVTALHLP